MLTTRAPERYRGSLGRYLEDFVVDDVYEHFPGRTILAADNTWFTLLTMNTNPIHFDYHYASKTEFGKPLVNSALTLAIVLGMSVADVSGKAIANLGLTDVQFTAPVFPGDTIYAESQVLEKRESKSRSTQGIVTVRTVGKNADKQRAANDVLDKTATQLEKALFRRGFQAREA